MTNTVTVVVTERYGDKDKMDVLGEVQVTGEGGWQQFHKARQLAMQITQAKQRKDRDPAVFYELKVRMVVDEDSEDFYGRLIDTAVRGEGDAEQMLLVTTIAQRAAVGRMKTRRFERVIQEAAAAYKSEAGEAHPVAMAPRSKFPPLGRNAPAEFLAPGYTREAGFTFTRA